MFDPTSRYANVETATLTVADADGRERVIAYKRRRFIPDLGRQPIIVEHIVEQGDRLDIIAARYIGDPLQFWRVCDSNIILHPEELTDAPGETIVVRLPSL